MHIHINKLMHVKKNLDIWTMTNILGPAFFFMGVVCLFFCCYKFTSRYYINTDESVYPWRSFPSTQIFFFFAKCQDLTFDAFICYQLNRSSRDFSFRSSDIEPSGVVNQINSYRSGIQSLLLLNSNISISRLVLFCVISISCWLFLFLF